MTRHGPSETHIPVAGNKVEAVSYLVDQTIPARNRLLDPLAAEKVRQGKVLNEAIGKVKAFSDMNRKLLLGVFARVTASLLAM